METLGRGNEVNRAMNRDVFDLEQVLYKEESVENSGITNSDRDGAFE